jgi:hypothetical protein
LEDLRDGLFNRDNEDRYKYIAMLEQNPELKMTVVFLIYDSVFRLRISVYG